MASKITPTHEQAGSISDPDLTPDIAENTPSPDTMAVLSDAAPRPQTMESATEAPLSASPPRDTPITADAPTRTPDNTTSQSSTQTIAPMPVDEAVVDDLLDAAPVNAPEVDTHPITPLAPLEVMDVDTIKAVPIDENAAKAVTPQKRHKSTHSLRTAPSNTVDIWTAHRTARLKDVLKAWSAKENIDFQWDVKKRVKMNKEIYVNGTFENALKIVFSRGIDETLEYSLTKDGQYVLHVTQ